MSAFLKREEGFFNGTLYACGFLSKEREVLVEENIFFGVKAVPLRWYGSEGRLFPPSNSFSYSYESLSAVNLCYDSFGVDAILSSEFMLEISNNRFGF